MSDWQSKIDLKDLFNKHDSDEISLPDLVQETLNRCKQNQFYGLFKHNVEAMQEKLDEIPRPVSEDHLNYLETQFDNFLDLLYDFGDRQHRIWISTCF